MGKFAKLKSKLAAQLEEEEKIEREFEKKITETGYEARFKDDEDDEDLETTSEEDSDNEEEHDGQNGVILFFNQKFENSVQNFAITLSRLGAQMPKHRIESSSEYRSVRQIWNITTYFFTKWETNTWA